MLAAFAVEASNLEVENIMKGLMRVLIQGMGAVVVAASGNGGVSTCASRKIDNWRIVVKRTDLRTKGRFCFCSYRMLTLLQQETDIFGGRRSYIDELPALWAGELPIITVGSVDRDGRESPFSQGGPLLSLSAMGTDATVDELFFTSQKSGTSYAAPTVAGLVATLMASDQFGPGIKAGGYPLIPQTVRKLLQDLAYARTPGGPISAYNGLQWSLPSSCSGGGRKRGACGESIDRGFTWCFWLIPSRPIVDRVLGHNIE